MSPRALVEWSRKNTSLVVECNTPVLCMHLAHQGGSPRAQRETRSTNPRALAEWSKA
jgi:hypothetical protein